MIWHSVPVVVGGGITAYVGLYHFWLHLRRSNQADLFFALTCLAMTSYDMFAALLYNSTSLEQGEPWQRLQVVAILALCVPFLFFVNSFAAVPRPRWFFLVVGIFAFGAVLIALEPWGLTFARPNVKHISTRLGPVTYFERDIGPLLLGFALTIPFVSSYIIWAARKGVKYALEQSATLSNEDDRRDMVRRARGRALSLSLSGCLVLVSLAYDTLVSFHLVKNVYLTEYSWFGVMFLMSWTLSDEVVDAASTRQALRETQARIATTLDAISDAVITTDITGCITHLNPAAMKMLAVSATVARGKALSSLVELTSPETLTQVADPIRYAVGRPPNPYGRLPRLVTTDGSDRVVDLGGAPLIDSAGRVQGAVVVFRDLTVQQSAIESLQHAKQMESMGQLAGGLAHDLNNLLTPILSYVELVQRQTDPASRAAVFLNHVQEAAQRAAGLTRHLLALSRKQVLDVQVIPLREFVRQTAPILKRLVPDNVEVELDLDERSGHVQVDPGQFEQVLLNLVSNARDAMPDGGRIVISTQRVNEREVVLGVTDHGTGIGVAVLDRIFEPFFTTKPRGKGTGLGLASVRGIIEQHGGSVYVDSEVGAGTTFDIILPIVDGNLARPSSRNVPPTDAARGHETVLVVEDDPAVRTLIHDALSQLGYNVRTADGLTTAVAVASSEAIDLLLTDVVMPGADGTRVHQAVLQYHQVPCLYMTGHADDRLGDRGFLAKGTEVLRKPFTVGQLAEKVRLVLERGSIAPRAEAPSSAPPSEDSSASGGGFSAL